MNIIAIIPARMGSSRYPGKPLALIHNVPMFFLLGGHDKKSRKAERTVGISDASARVREVFLAGRFPVVTTHQVEGRRIAKVLGLVCCRGFDSEEAFFGMFSGPHFHTKGVSCGGIKVCSSQN